jgi:hypothetical protein
VAEVSAVVETFSFLEIALEAPAPFLFFASATAVAFLAAAFFSFSLIVVSTRQEYHILHDEYQTPPKLY